MSEYRTSKDELFQLLMEYATLNLELKAVKEQNSGIKKPLPAKQRKAVKSFKAKGNVIKVSFRPRS